MEDNQQPQQDKPSLDGLDIQATRDLLARQGVPVSTPALPDFFVEDTQAQQPSPFAEARASELTGKDIYDYFQTYRTGPNKARFTMDESGLKAFNMMIEYMNERDIPVWDTVVNAAGQMRTEITEGINAMPNPVKDPKKFGATLAEGVYRGLRDIYGILMESEDPNSPFFKFRSYAGRLVGKDDGDHYSQMRQFNHARDFNDATYETNSLLAEMLPEGWRDHFSKYVDQKAAIGLSWMALDVPELFLSMGASTPQTAARLAATSSSKAARAAKAEKMWSAWTAATTDRVGRFGQRVLGNTMDATGSGITAPFKAIYGTSQATAQLAGDYAGNAVRNMATAEIVEAGTRIIGTTAHHPAVGFFRSFGAEAVGELLQVAGQDMVDRAMGKAMVKTDALGATTLERLAAGTAKGADAMSREAQLLAKGVNAAVGWAPSLSSATLKAMFRDGMFGAALGYGNATEEGAAAGATMGVAWGGMSGAIRHLHSYSSYTPQDTRVVDNFRDYVIPAFGRIMGPTSMEMAKRFHDKVNSYGDLRTSSIELSHLSTLVAHETGLVGHGNVMFYFGNSPQEFSNVMIESNVKPQDYDKVMQAFGSLSESAAAGMFEKITLNDGSVKRLIAINSDMYRPTTARHEITHALFRSVVEANSEMDSVINREDGRYMGDVFNPAYASRVFGTSKDMGVMPDAAWESLMTSYGAAQIWTAEGKPNDPVMMDRIKAMAKAEYGTLLSRIRKHLADGVNMQQYEVVNDFIRATNMAEEAFAYYASGTSNVFPVDKYVKDPAARNLLRGFAENRAARKNSRVLSSLEEAGVEIRSKFTNADGTPKLFDEQGNPAIETYMFDDGIVVRTPGMDSWVESVLKQAYARSEVLVSTLDPFRQEAFAKEHGKTHLFTSVPTGGMKLKSPSELDEASKDQANKILSAIQNVEESVRPVVEQTSEGNMRIHLEHANAQTMQAIQASGALTPKEFNELAAIVKVAEKNRLGDVTFNVMTGTLLAHTKQVRKGAGVFRLTGSDVPVTYRTFMPYSVEVNLKTHDAQGNPLRAPKGGILIHSIDVAAVNRRLMKMFKRPDVRSMFGGNFVTFVDRFNLYVQNQSGLNGAKVPSAELFRAEFGDRAEKVRDIMYESFGGRKRKDDAFINTPSDGYAGGADDPNRPFYTMRFDTLADIKVHPTSWNVHSKVQPFPYVHVQAYDGVARNFQITGFTERDLGNGKKYLKDSNGFEIYETKAGFALYDPFAIKVGVFKTAKAAIKRAGAELSKIDEADRIEQPENMINDTGHHDQALADLEVVTEASSRSVRFHLTGLRDTVAKSVHAGKDIADHIDSRTSAVEEVNAAFRNPPGGVERAYSSKYISLVEMLGEASKAFDTEVEINGAKYRVNLSDTHIAITDPTIGVARGTEYNANDQTELLRVDRKWFKDMYATDKQFLTDQLARRMVHAIKVSALHKAGVIPLPMAFTPESMAYHKAIGAALLDGAAGDAGKRDAAVSRMLQDHGTGMANLVGDIRWSFFDAGDPSKKNWSKNRSADNLNRFAPNAFTKGIPFIESRWRSAFSSFLINDAMKQDSTLAPIIAQAEASGIPASQEGRMGGKMPTYINLDGILKEPAARTAAINRLLASGATRGSFWEFHSKASGVDDILSAMEYFMRGSAEDRAELGRGRKGVSQERALTAQTPMREGVAKELVVKYIASLEAVAKKGGMFTKSVAGFFDKDGKLRKDEAGNKRGFVSSAVVMDISDPDIKEVASMEKLYTALSHIAKDIKEAPNDPALKNDYIRVLTLIMKMTTDKSLIFHEFKSMDDRPMKPGMNALPGRAGLFEGAANTDIDFYTLPPSIGFVVNADRDTALAYNPINVNRNHPSRYDRMAAERSLHIGEHGVPAMIMTRPKYGEGVDTSIQAGSISHVIATEGAIRTFMTDNEGVARTTMSPDSLRRTAEGIIPGGNSNWNGVTPSLALQVFAAPNGAAKLGALVPDAQKAVEHTISASMTPVAASSIISFIRSRVNDAGGISPAEVTMALKQADVAGDNMMIMEQLLHGYYDTFNASSAEVRQAGALRIAQNLQIHEAMFGAGLDADSFPASGKAQNLLSNAGIKTANITPASSDYVRSLREFIKTGSVASVDDGYRIMVREIPGSLGKLESTKMDVGFRTKKTDTVQSSPLMMITGSKAIAQLDTMRKDELLRLGLIGRMNDGLGRSFDYFQLSDSNAEINLSRFGGTISGLIDGISADSRRLMESYIKSRVASYINNDPNAIDNAASRRLINEFNALGLKMKDVISHPELYAFYPNIGEMSVALKDDSDLGASFGLGRNYQTGKIEHIFNINLGTIVGSRLSEVMKSEGHGDAIYDGSFDRFFSEEMINERFRRIMLHEIQHAVHMTEDMNTLAYSSLLRQSTDRYVTVGGSNFPASISVGADVNVARMFGSDDLVSINASAESAGDTRPTGPSIYNDIDDVIIGRLETLYGPSNGLLGFTRSNGANIVPPMDHDMARREMRKMLDAPMAVQVMREVIPNQMLHNQMALGELQALSMLVSSKLNEADRAEAMEIIAGTCEMVSDLDKYLQAEAMMMTKYDEATKLGAITRIRSRISETNRAVWSLIFGNNIVSEGDYNNSLGHIRTRVNTGLRLAAFKDGLSRDPNSFSNIDAAVLTDKMQSMMASLIYAEGHDELIPNLTAKRSRMSEADLAKLGPINVENSFYARGAAVASWMYQDLEKGYSLTQPPKLLQIGGSKGSEPINVSPFGESSANMFRAGLRMSARAGLLSHYVSVLNRDLMAYGKAMFESKGWRIGEDGMPIYVSERGMLTGMEDIFRTFENNPEAMAQDISGAIDSKARRNSSQYMTLVEGMENVVGNQNEVNATMRPVAKFITDNKFMPAGGIPKMSGVANRTTIPLLGGLTSDGKSVTIQDVAKAFGAVAVIEDTIGYKSEVLNALYQADTRGIPQVMQADDLIKVMREANVSDTDIASARLLEIQQKFAGTELSVGELIDLVSLVHEVPTLTSYSAGPTMRSMVSQYLSGPGGANDVKKLYDIAVTNGEPGLYQEAFRRMINSLIFSENGDGPLKGMFKAEVKGSDAGATGGRFFLMDAVETTVVFSYSSSDIIKRAVGGKKNYEALAKRIIEKIKKKYPDTETPNAWDPYGLQGMIVERSTRLDMSGEDTSSYNARDRMRIAAIHNFSARLESLLMRLTPMAEKLAEKMSKAIGKEQSLTIYDAEDVKIMDLLSEFYAEGLAEGLKGSFVTSGLRLDGGSFSESVRDFRYSAINSQNVSDVGKLGNLARRNYGYVGDSMAGGGMIMHGLVGGAMRAFADSAHITGVQSGMAGVVPSFGDVQESGLRRTYRNINFGPGGDVPESATITVAGSNMTLEGFGRALSDEQANAKEDYSIAKDILGSSDSRDYLAHMFGGGTDQKTLAMAGAIVAQRALMIKAQGLLNHISRFEGDVGMQRKLELVLGQSHLRPGNRDNVRNALIANPELYPILKGADLGPQITKAKALLSLASDIEQGLHNIGFGNITAEDHGWYRSTDQINRRNTPNYKPLSQASMVRAYNRNGAFVVTSAVEAMGALLSQPEVKVVNSLIKRDVNRSDLKTAAEPVRIIARTMSSGVNLLSELSDAPSTTPFRVGSPEIAETLKRNRIPRIATELGTLAKRIAAEYVDESGVIPEAEIDWYLYRANFNTRGLAHFLSTRYRGDKFVHRLASAMDGSTMLMSAAQVLKNAGESSLANKLQDFVQKNWKPIDWGKMNLGDVTANKIYYDSMTVYQKRAMLNFNASIVSAMIAAAMPDMGKHLANDINESAKMENKKVELMEALGRYFDGSTKAEYAGSILESRDKDTIERHFRGATYGLLNGLSIDRIKQISVMAGMAFLEREFLDKLGDGFSNEEKMAIKGAYTDLASSMDIIDEYDPTTTNIMKGEGWKMLDVGPGGTVLPPYLQAKNQLEYNVVRGALASQLDLFQTSKLFEGSTLFMQFLSGLEGRKNDIAYNNVDNTFKTRTREFDGGTHVVRGSYASPSDQWVARWHDANEAIALQRELIGIPKDVPLQNLDPVTYNMFMRDNGYSAVQSGLPFSANLRGVGGVNRAAYVPYDGQLGALGAMINHADPHDVIDAIPVQDSNIASIDVGPMGRSALSSSAIRGFVSDSIISRARQIGAPTIEIAPAGVQISHSSGGIAEIMGFNSGDGKDLQAKSEGMHGRGLRSLSLVSYQNMHAQRSKVPAMTQGGTRASEMADRSPDATYGTGYLGSPYQAGEFSPKKGFAWKRLPDGRIMINMTGDHLGYKSDYTLKGSGRVGYGFSLAEGVGYDPNSGLIIPGNAFSQIVASDYLAAFEHPLSGTFSNQDPMMMQAYIDAVVRDRRGYHHTRGAIPELMEPLAPGGSSLSGRLDRQDFLAFLMDPTKVFERRAFHASSYLDINAPSSYVSMILPGNMTVEDLAAHLVSMQVDPVIGGALNDASKRTRGERAKDHFFGNQFTGDRSDRGHYTGRSKMGVGIPMQNVGAYARGSVAGLTDAVKMAIARDPNLWNDAYAAAMKILGDQGGYFLPDTERTLAMNGDTGLAISTLFPGRQDLMKYSWDSKASHGIKVWKRTGPKDDPSFRAHVVELNAPSMINPDGGLVIGKKAIAFKTEAEAIAYANKVSASMTEASTLRALAGNDFRIVERPNEGGADKFMPEVKAREIERVIPMFGRAFQEVTEGTGNYRVGDTDMALAMADARKLARAIAKNTHIEFDTPPVSLRQITGSSLPELESIVRQKANFGLPQGALNFASKAMNAIVRGLPPNNRDFTHLTASDWLNLLKKNGVSKDEMRQTGLAHLLLNAGTMKLSRNDLAEFLAATFPVVQRTAPAFYANHAAQQLAALNLPQNETVQGARGTYVPPFVHDSRLQSRSNQLAALKGMYEAKSKMSIKLRTPEVEASPTAKEKLTTAIAYIDSKFMDFAKLIGVPESLMEQYKSEGKINPEYTAIWDHVVRLMGKDDEPFMTYDTRLLELGRTELNDKIRAFAADAADSAILADIPEIKPFVRSLLMQDANQAAVSTSLHLHNDAQSGTYSPSIYGYGSPMASTMGQVLFHYGSFPYTSYISGIYEQHHQAIVRFGDKVGLAKLNEYAAEIKKEITKVFQTPNDTPEIRKQTSERLALLKQIQDTVERVKSVRLASMAKLSKESRSHGTHFSSSVPGGSSDNMTGAKGAYELGHSRTGWGILTASLGLDGFATLTGVDKNGELPLLQRREPIQLIEEVQSDVFQNVDLIGAYSDPDMFLPVDQKDLEGFSRSGELAKLVADHASLRAMAEGASDKAMQMVQSIIGHQPPNPNNALVGTRTFDILSARLFLDQTDLFQRSMMHEAVPALMVNTGRKAKVPERIRESIRRLTNGQVSPAEIYVFDFDHELIETLRSYKHLHINTPPQVLEFIKERMKSNARAARHLDPSMPENPRARQAKEKLIRDVDGSNLSRVVTEQLSVLEQIINRGVEALRAQGYDALKNEVANITSMGVNSDHGKFLSALFRIGKESKNIGDVVAAHVARMLISDEQLATQMGAYAEGTAAIDYEGLVDRAIERIRKDYGDSKSYIGKAVLVILDEMKRMPAEARPHATASTGFAEIKTRANSPLVDRYTIALDSIGSNSSPLELNDIIANLPPIDPTKDIIYVRAGGFDRQRSMVVGPDSNTFRAIKSPSDFVGYIQQLRLMGYSPDSDIVIYAAPYHRHAGSAAGDFAKNVVEVYASMNQGPKFERLAAEKEAEISAMRKQVKETFDPDQRASVQTPRGMKTIYPENIPLVADGFYKRTQLIMNVLDSMNHGQHGIGIMDATYQLQRNSSGLRQPISYLRMGANKGYLIPLHEIAKAEHGDVGIVQAISGAILAFEKKRGTSANGPEGPYAGFFHRLRTMDLHAELGSSPATARFEHNGHTDTISGHLKLAIIEMMDSMRGTFDDSYVMTCQQIVNRSDFDLSRHMAQHGYEGGKAMPGVRAAGREDKVAVKAGEQSTIFTIAGASGESAGWGYISNYGLPMYALDLIAPGTSADFRSPFALDLFERPTLNVDGNYLVLTDKTGRIVEKLDQSTASKQQMESFRERYLQLSQYKGRNWMVGSFLNEFGPAGGYIDFGIVGPTSTFRDFKGAYPMSGDAKLFENLQQADVLSRIRAGYIDKGLLPTHLTETSPAQKIPGLENIYHNAGDITLAVEEQMRERGIIGDNVTLPVGFPREAESHMLGGSQSQILQGINPLGKMVQPLTPFSEPGGSWFHAGLNDLNHVRGLVNLYFPRASADPAAAAAYIIRMTNPLTTTMVHTPLRRTKEQDIQFRRRVLEGIPLMQITGTNVARGESISPNGVKKLAYLLKQRDMLPKIKDQDERP